MQITSDRFTCFYCALTLCNGFRSAKQRERESDGIVYLGVLAWGLKATRNLRVLSDRFDVCHLKKTHNQIQHSRPHISTHTR